MRRRNILKAAPLVLTGLALVGCGGGGGPAGPRGPDVLGVARANGLGRFVRAVETGGLSETLAGPGPYTIFAPTDRAFGASRAARLDPDGLRNLVAYHVVPGQLTTDFLDGYDINHTTLLGTSLNVNGIAGLRVNDASVLRADLMASNGVVFVIDRVLTPR